MKKYIRTRKVEAEPMTVSEFYHLTKQCQYGEMVENGEGGVDGYRIVYEDGFEGWTEKDKFEKSYKVADTPLDRLHIEMRDLYERVDKLVPFIDSGKMKQVISDDYMKALLKLQRVTMRNYIHILEARIGRMDDAPEAEMHLMDFGTAIHALREGYSVRRRGWAEKGLFVIKQIPARITEEIVPKMQSLPQSAKDLILKGKGFINYTSQCLIYNENTGRADSWVPSIIDVFAEDWEIVTQNNNQ